MKRILFLGGAQAQLPIIVEAKAKGYYVITCDYLPSNPGHKLADEYHNISTTDLEGVYRLSKKVNPDIIFAYASDVAAPVAAYVSEKLELPTNSFQSVSILAEKDQFRALLKQNGFNVPGIIVFNSEINNFPGIDTLNWPVVIKPTDSAGTKGISKIESIEQVPEAIAYAKMFSRNGKLIAEEFIDNENGDLHGDGFVVDGKLVFYHLGDHIYNKSINPINPVGTTWPSHESSEKIESIGHAVQKIIMLSGFKNGPINIEARFNVNNKLYIMEIGPRSGGFFVPQAIAYSSGFDMVKASLDIYDSKPVIVPINQQNYFAYYAVHSEKEGLLESVIFEPELESYIKDYKQLVDKGSPVKVFISSNLAIGVLILEFPSRSIMEGTMNRIKQLIRINVN